MLVGSQTWEFKRPPTILSTGTVGGPFEAKGQLTAYFDQLYDDIRCGQKTFEQANQIMLETACNLAINKSDIPKEQVQFLIAGDLTNQMTPTNFAASTLQIPFIGTFNACATSMESLALAANLIDSGAASSILTGASSHNAAAERQFRYPTEYGAQKPDSAQWTVTGAGVGLISNTGNGPKITSATLGKVIDMNMTDPFNMGGAMAPAAMDTITIHLKDRGIDASYYDAIITGDLAKVGRSILLDLAKEQNITLREDTLLDCGLMIYKDDQKVFAGGSGAGCSAVVTYGYVINQLKQKKWNRLLIVATGALLSPLSVQQKQSIPCIAHAVSIENEVKS
ncbi:stage V sporulation protein AD [Paraliobacillus ryukyuensis]|uniref:Stage V sporulation protein AD n=1 Tax=Paraliobacillus ryukyuensis TaxID=200904 RepID=A0A366DWP7_9BACI|nr:stage V sporulation protein AD [Paraliobacillus ryukyuensis]RBO94531.1 stage V sporulation protein AD [Paraliobacillus ryukyuensis]